MTNNQTSMRQCLAAGVVTGQSKYRFEVAEGKQVVSKTAKEVAKAVAEKGDEFYHESV
jgi:hypothetical protein